MVEADYRGCIRGTMRIDQRKSAFRSASIRFYNNMIIPTISPNDEVLVKDLDGSWKIFTGGQLIPLQPKPAVVSAPVTPAATPSPTIPPQRIPVAAIVSTPGRPVMSDVRAPKPMTIGPVEELRMSLEDYLRSGATAAARADGVRARIKQLEAQDYSKRVEGITSWKRSEVYSLYVVLGQEGVLGNVSIEQSIQKRVSSNQPTLSVEDFQAITRLNNDLRN